MKNCWCIFDNAVFKKNTWSIGKEEKMFGTKAIFLLLCVIFERTEIAKNLYIIFYKPHSMLFEVMGCSFYFLSFPCGKADVSMSVHCIGFIKKNFQTIYTGC